MRVMCACDLRSLGARLMCARGRFGFVTCRPDEVPRPVHLDTHALTLPFDDQINGVAQLGFDLLGRRQLQLTQRICHVMLERGHAYTRSLERRHAERAQICRQRGREASLTVPQQPLVQLA